MTVPATVARGVLAGGGVEKSSTGCRSSPLTVAAKKPIPRCAKTFQIVLAWAPRLPAWSACRMALRMSRKDG